MVSYALESGDDPVAAVDRARANGHDLVWINQRAACLTSHREPRQALIVVDNGDLIRIEGKLYRIRLFDRVHIALDPFTPEA